MKVGQSVTSISIYPQNKHAEADWEWRRELQAVAVPSGKEFIFKVLGAKIALSL